MVVALVLMYCQGGCCWPGSNVPVAIVAVGVLMCRLMCDAWHQNVCCRILPSVAVCHKGDGNCPQTVNVHVSLTKGCETNWWIQMD